MRPEFTAKAIPHVNKVSTVRGVQHHRGFTGVVQFPGDRTVYRTNTFHQKRRTAQATAERYARWLMKNPDARAEIREDIERR